MNCERVQDLFLEFEAGNLPDNEAAEVREHLRTCPACQREWSTLVETVSKLEALPEPEPSARMKTQFYAMLDTHLSGRESAHPFAVSRSRLDRWVEALWPRRPVWQLSSALALLALGLVVGKTAFTAPARTPDSTAIQLAATQKELAELRSRVESVDQLVTYSLAALPSAQSRLKQVVSASQDPAATDQALAQLLNALAFDPSTHVRLSALEALYARAEQVVVRKGVLVALTRETSPLVQVAMIDFLAAVQETDAGPTLQQLAHAPTADQAVRTAAQRALALL